MPTVNNRGGTRQAGCQRRAESHRGPQKTRRRQEERRTSRRRKGRVATGRRVAQRLLNTQVGLHDQVVLEQVRARHRRSPN